MMVSKLTSNSKILVHWPYKVVSFNGTSYQLSGFEEEELMTVPADQVLQYNSQSIVDSWTLLKKRRKGYTKLKYAFVAAEHYRQN